MIVIRGAEVYNPAQGYEGQVRDVWIEGNRIIAPPEEPAIAQVIDGRGKIIAPAGVEIHTHVAGYPLNAARRFLLSENTSPDSLIPSPADAAKRYLQLGYTTVFDAASSPMFAQSTVDDLQQMNGIDRGTFTLLGDNKLLLRAIASGNDNEVVDTLAWLITVSGGYAVKLVNPGGGLAWKTNRSAPGLDDPVGIGTITQRDIICKLAELVNKIGLPHPVHIHAGKLGQPGNYTRFCDTVKALEGLRAHMCHIQFFSYGMDKTGVYTSAASQVVKCLEACPQITCDVGQILFGDAMAVTADTAALSGLQRSMQMPWISRQVEGEGGNNVLPLRYASNDPTSAVQWAAGLELLLSFHDPSRMFLTTDHPNGAPFEAYPQVISWLMSNSARQEALKKMHPDATQKSGLAGLGREYSLGEIFTMTSYGPAQALGLMDRGHLEPGSVADLRCYTKQEDMLTMFQNPAWVMRQGRVVIQDGKSGTTQPGNLLIIRPEFDDARLPAIKRNLAEFVSIPFEKFALGNDGLLDAQEVPCTSTMS